MKGRKGMETVSSLIMKYGTSRGAETYGYATASAWIDGKRMGMASGGGYDLSGAALGEAAMKAYGPRLAAIADRAANVYHANENRHESRDKHGGQYLYGLSVIIRDGKTSVYVDGACGWNCVVRVLEAIGVTIAYVDETRSRKVYTLTDKGAA